MVHFPSSLSPVCLCCFPHTASPFSIGVQEHTSFQVIQISFYANQLWAQNRGSGWLDELQTHGWESESGTITFLHPWSRGNFSNEELEDLQLLFRFYFIGLTKEVQNYASQLQFKCKFNQLN